MFQKKSKKKQFRAKTNPRLWESRKIVEIVKIAENCGEKPADIICPRCAPRALRTYGSGCGRGGAGAAVARPSSGVGIGPAGTGGYPPAPRYCGCGGGGSSVRRRSHHQVMAATAMTGMMSRASSPNRAELSAGRGGYGRWVAGGHMGQRFEQPQINAAT